ncbi:dTDP-4-dehydrorhamnose reductase [Maridesulfovibrio bastinii]|uniref:dTDP-4-dehydrorhamnose reductase n=1 Tax=Maridesulfovibrio bastinii TaxID=47157 RepID=UPI00041C6791|nr:dTDP-4-dehydrorhamnose reductase [Maridesulfovibrio bastinii]
MINLEGKKAVIFGGKNGLLGQSVTTALNKAGVSTIALSRSDFDPLDDTSLNSFLDRESPDYIINTIAYTKVDQAEEETSQAHLLNTTLPVMLARAAKTHNAAFVHYSTDFVFDGTKDHPYTENDTTNPVSVYGQTKLAGETEIFKLGYEKVFIIRTAWLFGPHKTNFVHKILNLAKDRDNLTVVHDQNGSPTYTPDLALHTVQLLESDCHGLYHIVNSGKSSWCELADEAINCAGIDCRVEPVPSSAYPTIATRPPYSVLDTQKFTEVTGITPRPWVQALRDYVYNDFKELD